MVSRRLLDPSFCRDYKYNAIGLTKPSPMGKAPRCIILWLDYEIQIIKLPLKSVLVLKSMVLK